MNPAAKKYNDFNIKAAYTISQRTLRLSARTPVRASEMTVTQPVAPHDHDYCEVCLVIGGSGWHITPHSRRALRRGSILLTVPGEIHAFETRQPLRVINLYYLSEWLLRDAGNLDDNAPVFSLFFARALFRAPLGLPVVQFRLGPEETRLCERELRDIAAECHRSAPSRLFLRAAMTKFMIVAASQALRAAPDAVDWLGTPARHTARSDGGVGRTRPEVWAAVREIESQIAEGKPFEAARLGQGASITAIHLARLFKQQTGWTPSDYYQFRRVQRAGALLLEGRQSITEVAVECGYADASHLGRNFQRFLGMSPRGYREMYAASA